MNPKASLERSISVPAAARTSRALGPPTAATAHCSVTLVQYTSQVGPFGLQPLLEPVEHGGGAAGRRRDEVVVLGEAHRDAVVEDHPVEAEHQPVADRADREVRHPVRVHPVEERRRRRRRRRRSCRACSRRADRRPPGPRGTRARPRRPSVLAAREVPGTQPLADRLEDRARGDVPGVHRRRPDRVEEVASGVDARDRAEGDGRVRRPCVRGALRAGGPAEHRVHESRR